jgi:hypothetical protein
VMSGVSEGQHKARCGESEVAPPSQRSPTLGTILGCQVHTIVISSCSTKSTLIYWIDD